MTTMTLDDHVAADTELAPRNVVGSDGDIRARYLALVARLNTLDSAEYRTLKALGARLDRTPVVDWKDDGDRVQTRDLRLAERHRVKEYKGRLAAAEKKLADLCKPVRTYYDENRQERREYSSEYCPGRCQQLTHEITQWRGTLWNAEHAEEVAAKYESEHPETFGAR